MQHNIVNIIKQYLSIETNYAVIISGGYGIGKTHCFKNILSPEIRKTLLPKNDKKKYKPVHISLFGVNSLEDVQTQIFLELHSILKNKKLKLAGSITKSIFRGISNLGGLGSIDEYLSDLSLNSEDWLNYNEIVICFDDFDRKSEELKNNDIFGFINTLVENCGAKVIIIANQNVLKEKDKEISIPVEKVIGVSIEFIPEVSQVYDLIIGEKYSDDREAYFKLLKEKKPLIIEAVRKNNNNFRNLVFFLEHFKTIYHPLEIEFEHDKSLSIEKDKKLESILLFSLSISIEFKNGSLSYENYDDIKDLSNKLFREDLLPIGLNNNDTPREESYFEKFQAKYYSNHKYLYFDTIFKYIVGQSAFNVTNLKWELDKYFKVENGNLSPTQQLLTTLGYFDCLELGDKTYRTKTLKLLEFVDKGELQLFEYPTAFHYATRFDNLLSFNIENLKNRFRKGISKGFRKYAYDRQLHFRLAIDEKTEYKEDLQEIGRYCIEINKKLGELIEKDKIIKIEQLFSSNFNAFLEMINDTNERFSHLPVFQYFSSENTYRTINKLSNKEIIELAFLFQDRYNRVYEALAGEKDFLVNILHKIDKPKKRKIKNLRNASLNFLSKKMTGSIKNFPND